MANSWLRLWHDMPNDPKWRTIARISGQRIGDVQSVYMHLLTSASQNVTRGHADVTAEDLASAIDVTEDVIQAILGAMQGRVLDGFRLSGWDKRQPKREDSGSEESGAKSSAERKRLQREREKAAQEPALENQCHNTSRNVTLDKEKDTDKSREEKNTRPATGVATPDGVSESVWSDFKKLRAAKKAAITKTAIDGIKREADTAGMTLCDALAMCCERGWTGFKAEWASQHTAGGSINKQEALEARNRAVGQRWADGAVMAGAI